MCESGWVALHPAAPPTLGRPADHACAAALRPPGPCPMSPQQPQLARFADGAHARIDRQLAVHVLHMAFHRVARQEQRIGDLAVAHAVGHQAQDLLFARAQRFFQRRRCLCRAGRWRGAGRLQLGNDAPRDERVDGGAAAQHAADGDAHLQVIALFQHVAGGPGAQRGQDGVFVLQAEITRIGSAGSAARPPV